MSDQVRDKIAEMVPGIKKLVSRPDYTLPYQVADQIIAIFRKEGGMFPDDIVEGMVLSCDACIDKFHHDVHVCALCRDGEATKMPATLREHLAGKAVPA